MKAPRFPYGRTGEERRKFGMGAAFLWGGRSIAEVSALYGEPVAAVESAIRATVEKIVRTR